MSDTSQTTTQPKHKVYDPFHASNADILPHAHAPNVDFIVGSQYGDEGKGMVCKLIADAYDDAYAWTARVGAQNAEHRFIHNGCDLCARILPSAAAFRSHSIRAYLGAGHCFRPEHLALEAVHLGVPPERIWVDKHAMWLTDEHAISNRERGDKRGTTGWGVGAAIAEKVARSPETKLIGECPELLSWLPEGHVTTVAEQVAKESGWGLFEGSQGAMLSLNHGRYPWCTAKDVTVPNMCAELGISTRRVRRVLGVVRLVLMRVSGPSGPTGGQEVSYDEVERRTGLRFPQHKRLQGDSMRWTSTAGVSLGVTDEERLFDLSMEELVFSHALNGYTHLAVTFCDMHRSGNYRVTKWEHLHEDTRKTIETIEDLLNVPVVLVRTGQGEHDNIWLADSTNPLDL